MTERRPDQRDRFLRLMVIVVAVVGLITFGLALYNSRQGGAISWITPAVFLIIIAALLMVRRR